MIADFTVAQWHPDDGVSAERNANSLGEALTIAKEMRGSPTTPKGDTRVTIHFNGTGRWLEWWYDAVDNEWVFDEM